MPVDPVEITSQSKGAVKEGSADRHLPQSDDEVIEIISDDDVEIIQSEDAYDNDIRVSVPEGGQSDDEIQITHVNTIAQSPSEFGNIRRNRENNSERNIRRRYEATDDDVQLVNERPLLRPLSVNAIYDDQDEDYREGSVVHTPRGDFHTDDAPRFMGTVRRVVQRPRPRTRNVEMLLNNRNLRRRRQISSRFYSELEQFEIPFDLFGNTFFHFPANGEESVENSIMERIERDNENALDSRLATEKIFNRKFLDEKKELTKKEMTGYTNDITPDSELCCELCAISLGDGIPEDFEVDHRYDQNLEDYSKQYRANAPWFCVRICSEADIALSRRVFIAKCGHLYCGRCVKNIGNRPPRVKGKKLGISILNPHVYSPRKCPATECNRQFTSKGFTELYF